MKKVLIIFTILIASLSAFGQIDTINIGTSADSGDGDKLRTAMYRVNLFMQDYNRLTIYDAAGTTGTTSTNLVFSTSPTLITPALGTPSALVGTNITGTALGLGVGTVSGLSLGSGSLALVGDDALTFTTSGVTGVTLPTSGTLATLASPSFTGTLGIAGNISMTSTSNIYSANAMSFYTTGPADNILIDANTGGVGEVDIGVTGDNDTLNVFGTAFFNGLVSIPTPFTLGAVSVTATGTELNRSIGLTDVIQDQLDLKAAIADQTHTGVTTITELRVGDGTSNTIASIDSSSVFDSGTLVTFIGADTINNYTPHSARSTTVPIELGDSTGALEGNYMTANNYYNNMSRDNSLKALKDLGSNIVGYPIYLGDPYSSMALGDSRVYLIYSYLAEPTTLTGLSFQIATAGDFAPNNENRLGLYSVSGETYTLVAATDTCSLAFMNSGVNEVPFADAIGGSPATYEAAAGYYMTAIIYNNSTENTPPSIRSTSINLVLLQLGGDRHIVSYETGNATLPAQITAADLSSIQTSPILFIYE